jgi:hypothetical protein
MSVSGGTNRTTSDVRSSVAIWNQRPQDSEGVDGRTACKPDTREDAGDDEAQRCSRRPTRTSV